MFEHVLTALDLLLSTKFYFHPLVFFIYCLSVSHRARKLNSWTLEETRAYPLASLCSILVVNLGGHILLTIFKGDGLIQVFQNDTKVLIVTFAWWLVYFSPGDFVWRWFLSRPSIQVHTLLIYAFMHLRIEI